MLNSIKSELTKRSFRLFCQENESFATGVLQQLVSTDLCLFAPNRSNKFSRLAFKFPLTTNEEFLECVLDCVELLSEEPASLSVLDDEDAAGFILAIKSVKLIGKLVKHSSDEDPWLTAGIMFAQINKNKTTDNNITIIDSNLFGKNTFNIVNKFNYLLL